MAEDRMERPVSTMWEVWMTEPTGFSSGAFGFPRVVSYSVFGALFRI